MGHGGTGFSLKRRIPVEGEKLFLLLKAGLRGRQKGQLVADRDKDGRQIGCRLRRKILMEEDGQRRHCRCGFAGIHKHHRKKAMRRKQKISFFTGLISKKGEAERRFPFFNVL